ncbi:MAG TPA: hypothetical protein PKA27_15825 [Fimbriimonadaceae bacterium]|nr:hypothetical protein [Fimbriimonadaceae bacterium]
MKTFALLAILPISILLNQTTPQTKAPSQPAAKVTFEKDIVPLVKKYCVSCHNPEKKEHNIDFTKFKTEDDVKKEPRMWRNSGKVMERKTMPPKEEKVQPTDAERKLFADWCATLPRR